MRHLAYIAAAVVLVTLSACRDATGPTAAFSPPYEEVEVDCDNLTLEEAETILRDAGVLDYIRSHDPPPSDADIIEAGTLVCTGGVRRNPDL